MCVICLRARKSRFQIRKRIFHRRPMQPMKMANQSKSPPNSPTLNCWAIVWMPTPVRLHWPVRLLRVALYAKLKREPAKLRWTKIRNCTDRLTVEKTRPGHAVIVANAIAGNQLCVAMKMTNAEIRNHRTNVHTVNTRQNNAAISACMCANIIPTSRNWKAVASDAPSKSTFQCRRKTSTQWNLLLFHFTHIFYNFLYKHIFTRITFENTSNTRYM